MFTRLLLAFLCVGVLTSLSAQEYRTFDGTGNNINNPDWGATHTQMLRLTPVDYADNIGEPGGQDRPNPRTISNTIFQQDSLIMDGLALSDYIWVWGQFLDHDITLAAESNTEPAMIPVPQGDPWFDPFNTGQMMIPMTRNTPMFGTGVNIGNPRQHVNEITAFVDGSNVYGSDEERADWLRTFEDGKLFTSDNDLLPFNTINKKQFSAVHPGAPEMADPVGISNKHFVAGDVRANENPLLTAFHTLFVREHNRLCDVLKAAHPEWNDDELYHHARTINAGFIQKITFDDWLEAMGSDLADYTGYDNTINPGISNVFSGAAFRLGHTLISGTIRRMDMEGNTIPEGDISLAEAFFNPWVILSDGGIEPLLKGMGTQIQQDLDVQVVSDVRNFLFGPPGAGGLDLAAININRGRERGIPDFNTVRTTFGLAPITSFIELTDNQEFADKLETLYGTVDKIDAWVGMLAEKHMADALFGETIMEIMVQQFGGLRDGDRFYYENDPNLSPEEITEIKNTTLGDIIERNTNIPIMQENVFYAMPHDMLCTADEPMATISGQLETTLQTGIGEVAIEVEELNSTNSFNQTAAGGFDFPDLATCNGYKITPIKDINPANGVSTFDLVLVRKHILGTELLDDPIALLAADANSSNSVSTIDMVAIRKVILNPNVNFENSTSWKFFPADVVFDNNTNPWASITEDFVIVENLEEAMQVDFMGYKVGDVNFSADANNLIATDGRTDESLVFEANNQMTQKGEYVSLTFRADEIDEIEGYQFTLNYDNAALEFVDLEQGALAELANDNFNVMKEVGAITTSWVGNTKNVNDASLFTLNFMAKESGKALADLVELNSKYTKAEAVNTDLDILNIDLVFNSNETIVNNEAFILQSIEPNPFAENTNIRFQLPENELVTISIFDVTGKAVFTHAANFEAGNNEFQLSKKDLKTTGLFYCQIESAFGMVTEKLVVE